MFLWWASAVYANAHAAATSRRAKAKFEYQCVALCKRDKRARTGDAAYRFNKERQFCEIRHSTRENMYQGFVVCG